ncbi:MAG: hypothetical protein EXS00_09370 [Phycisphaerales bacterium]|nr:hypothetical protein [Phycisphaerales bacterium]
MKRKHQQRQQLDPAVIAAIAPTATGGWVAVAIREEPRGVSYVASEQFESSDGAINLWISQTAQASRTVVVLPEGRVVARTVALPDASPESIDLALRLQVENFLLGGTPRHRTAAALLPIKVGSTRVALMLEWPESSQPILLPSGIEAGTHCTFTAPVVAAASIACAVRAKTGATVAALALAQTEGALSVGVIDSQRALFRTVHESATDSEPWSTGVTRAITETVLLGEFQESIAADLARQAAAVSSGFFTLPEAAAALPSAPADSDWWNRFGIAAGAAIAATGSMLALTRLQPLEIATKRGAVAAVISSLSDSKVATRLCLAAVLLLAVAPPAFAWLRLELLRSKVEDPTAYRTRLEKSERQIAMYEDLGRISWPMTKLLGDIASNVPEGIELSSVLLLHGERITLRGSAKPQAGMSGTDALLNMEEQLLASQVFDRVEKSWDPPDAKGVYKFTMSTSVASPLLVPNYPEVQDFGRKTLRERRYGPDPSTAGAAAPTAPIGAAATGAEGDAASELVAGAEIDDGAAGHETRSGQRDTSGVVASGVARRGRTPSTATPGTVIPDPLTDQQITAMTQTEAREALGKIATARMMPGLDDATKKRLREEWDKLFERAKKP